MNNNFTEGWLEPYFCGQHSNNLWQRCEQTILNTSCVYIFKKIPLLSWWICGRWVYFCHAAVCFQLIVKSCKNDFQNSSFQTSVYLGLTSFLCLPLLLTWFHKCAPDSVCPGRDLCWSVNKNFFFLIQAHKFDVLQSFTPYGSYRVSSVNMTTV